MSFLSLMRSLSDLTQAIPQESDPVSTDPASTINPEFDSALGTLSSTLSGMNQDMEIDSQYMLNNPDLYPYTYTVTGYGGENGDGPVTSYEGVHPDIQIMWALQALPPNASIDDKIGAITSIQQPGWTYSDVGAAGDWLMGRGMATYEQLRTESGRYGEWYNAVNDDDSLFGEISEAWDDIQNSDLGTLALGTTGLMTGGAIGAGALTGNLDSDNFTDYLAADLGGLAAGVGAASVLPEVGLSTMAGATSAPSAAALSEVAATGMLDTAATGATAGTAAGAAGATLGADTLAGAGGTVGLTDVVTGGAGSAGGEEVFDDIFDLGDLGDVGGDIFGDDYGDVLDGVIGGDFPDMGDFNWEDINLEDFDWGEVFGGENMEDLYDDFWNYFSQEAMGGLVPTNSGPNWWDVGFGLLQYQGQRQFQNDIINSMNQAVERSDPFYSQRPFYQQQFQQMNTDPNYFQNDAALQNLQNSAMRSMASQDAAKGYLNSGNILHDLTRTGVETAANYVLPRMDMSARAAGAYNDPSKAGQMIAAMSPIAASAGLAQNQTLGQIGRSATGAQTGTNSGTNPITSLAQWLTA